MSASLLASCTPRAKKTIFSLSSFVHCYWHYAHLLVFPQQLPHSNAVWNEDRLLLLPSVNISVRVSREGRLLPAPVIIRDADRASVQSIASAIERAQSGDNGALPAPSASLMLVLLYLSGPLCGTHIYLKWQP